MRVFKLKNVQFNFMQFSVLFGTFCDLVYLLYIHFMILKFFYIFKTIIILWIIYVIFSCVPVIMKLCNYSISLIVNDFFPFQEFFKFILSFVFVIYLFVFVTNKKMTRNRFCILLFLFIIITRFFIV